jgi:peptidoglycan/LPS O-acetylase OafA/YrhL
VSSRPTLPEAEAPPRPVATGTERAFGYQPALDGVRAIAVLAVIAYHTPYSWAKGGFLGVDTFFVLSGFLITTLLVLEWRRMESIGLLAFWGRRVRRLLPALLLVLAFVAIYGLLVIPPYELTKLRLDSLSGLFYVANWRFVVSGQSYFDLFSTPSPVRHLWSLAIEEQFYLVWPLVVLACLRFARGRLRVLVGVCVAGVIASVYLMSALFRADDPSRAYYGTDSRAHTILVGCLLALLLLTWKPVSRQAKVAIQVLGVAGALGVAWAMHTLGDVQPGYYGLGSLLFALAVAAVIAAAVQPGLGFVRTPLSWRPLRWIGMISYGLYLWHWPIDVWLVESRTGIDGTALNALRLAATFGFATASFYLVERPIRQGKFLGLRRPSLRFVVPGGVLLVVLTIMISTAGASSAPPLFGDASHPYPCPPSGGKPVQEAKQELAHLGGAAALPQDKGLKVELVGDSVACSLWPGLIVVGKAAGLKVTQNAVIACGIASGEVVTGAIPAPSNSGDCPNLVDSALGDVKQVKPDVVLVLSTWERADLQVGGSTLKAGTKEWERAVQKKMDAVLKRLVGTGAHVVITTQPSQVPAEFHQMTDADISSQGAAFDRLNLQLLKFAARHPKTVTLVDLAGKVCPGGSPCPTKVDGIQPRPLDGGHFSPQAAVWATKWLLPELEKAGQQRAHRP